MDWRMDKKGIANTILMVEQSESMIELRRWDSQQMCHSSLLCGVLWSSSHIPWRTGQVVLATWCDLTATITLNCLSYKIRKIQTRPLFVHVYSDLYDLGNKRGSSLSQHTVLASIPVAVYHHSVFAKSSNRISKLSANTPSVSPFFIITTVP